MRLIHSQQTLQSISWTLFFLSSITSQTIGQLRQPWQTATLSWALSCPVVRPSGGQRGEARWGAVRWEWGLTAASLRQFCTVSRWGKKTLICSMSCALCARGTSVLAGTQRLAVSSRPLNEAFVISLRATRDGKCSSAVFCWQDLSYACSFLTDSCPVTVTTKLGYDSLWADASVGLPMIMRKGPQKEGGAIIKG